MSGIRLLALLFTVILTSVAEAAISVDDTVARVAVFGSNNVPVSTASFAPPAGALLLVIVNSDGYMGTDPFLLSVSDSQILEWTQIVRSDNTVGITQDGHVSAWYAVVPTSTAMTVTVQFNNMTDQYRLSFKTYIVTGYDTGMPIGATGFGQTTTNNASPQRLSSGNWLRPQRRSIPFPSPLRDFLRIKEIS